MDDFQQLLKRRALVEDVRVRLMESPAVALLGARQVGKTTLAEQIAADWHEPTVVLDLESMETREALKSSPQRFLAKQNGLIVIDEVQRMPELFEVLRPLCDDRRRKSRFLLLGSASWELVKGVLESLAGRIQFVDAGGFSLTETGAAEQDKLWLRGGFPRAFLAANDDAWERWMESFSRTFLERDIPGLSRVASPELLGRFWRMLAHYHGQSWNAAELARTMDVGVKTVNHYLELLAGTFMVRLLAPWHENLGKRLVKSPKVYLRDSGVLHFLSGVSSMNELLLHPRMGASWEGFALEQMLLAHGARDSYFYRTQRGAELDLLLLRKGKRWGFEFKHSDAPRTSKSMHVALEDLKLEHLYVIYPGDTEYDLTEKISTLPMKNVASLKLTRFSSKNNKHLP